MLSDGQTRGILLTFHNQSPDFSHSPPKPRDFLFCLLGSGTCKGRLHGSVSVTLSSLACPEGPPRRAGSVGLCWQPESTGPSYLLRSQTGRSPLPWVAGI